MQWMRVVAACGALGAIGAVMFVTSCAKQTSETASTGTTGSTMTVEQKIEHGRRLALSSGCVDCHTPGSLYGTPDTTRMLSGSELGWQGPWGVSYARNLTPDSTTGIGTWTEDQIVAAFTTGHRPDGTALLPPMPWPGFGAGFTPDDAHALAAYLKSIPAVSHQVPAAIPPGKPATGAMVTFPPPPAWDARNLPPMPPGGAPAH